MFISKGSLNNFTYYHSSIKLVYYQSLAQNPPDKLIYNNKKYEIKQGSIFNIPKLTKFKIISNDPKSLRVYKKKKKLFLNILNLQKIYLTFTSFSLYLFFS